MRSAGHGIHLTFVSPPSLLEVGESVLGIERHFLRIQECGVDFLMSVVKQSAWFDVHLVDQVGILGVLHLPDHFILLDLLAVHVKALQVLQEDLILLEPLSFDLPLSLVWHSLCAFLIALEAHG